MENVIKEAWEEASIPATLARTAQSAGYVSYIDVDERKRLKRDTLFCFDLEIPSEFIPSPLDGEVQSFELQDVSWIINKLCEGGEFGFKSNINLTMLDFLVRSVMHKVDRGIFFLRPFNVALFFTQLIVTH